MAVLRVGIADDEPPAVRRLVQALANLEDVRVVGTAGDGHSALELVRGGDLDVMLLDIRMPGLTGVELIRALDGAPGPAFIFVTAFSQFAAEAFELDAVDYLLKPVAFDRLRQALDRARRTLAQRNDEARVDRPIAAPGETSVPPSPATLQEIWTTERGDRIRLAVSQIEWIEAERDYVRIHMALRSHLIRRTLKSLAAELEPDAFLAVSRSALVRKACVARLHRRGGGSAVIVLQSGAEVRVARRHAASVRRALLAEA